MLIKKATLNDLDNIVSLNKLFHIDMPNFYWDTKEWVQKEIDNFYVFKIDNQLIGAISLLIDNSEVYIETIAVDRKYQSKGYGKALIKFAKNFTKKNNLNILWVNSFESYNLKKFYLSCGFNMFDTDEEDSYHGHHTLHFYINSF
jgi:N-acetylglutamate synthase-like GNAT family acetyltransferase